MCIHEEITPPNMRRLVAFAFFLCVTPELVPIASIGIALRRPAPQHEQSTSIEATCRNPGMSRKPMQSSRRH
jgi:hypothetical protein